MTDEQSPAAAAPPAKKTAAKKAPASKPKVEKVGVILVHPSHGAPAGTRRRVAASRAKSLVGRGLARYEKP